MTTATAPVDLMTVQGVARRLGCSTSYAKILILTGRIPSFRTIGGRFYLVYPSDVEEFAKERDRARQKRSR
jgi:excisionase family DNA binding protein